MTKEKLFFHNSGAEHSIEMYCSFVVLAKG